MAKWHLLDLEKKLDSVNLLVHSVGDGNDYDIAAKWEIALPNGAAAGTLIFEGLGDGGVLPLDQSYGVYCSSDRSYKVYIPKRKPRTPKALEEWNCGVQGLINILFGIK